MSTKKVPIERERLLKRPAKQNDVRITTCIERELYEEVMRLNRAGISVQQVINEAVADLMKKYDLL